MPYNDLTGHLKIPEASAGDRKLEISCPAITSAADLVRHKVSADIGYSYGVWGSSFPFAVKTFLTRTCAVRVEVSPHRIKGDASAWSTTVTAEFANDRGKVFQDRFVKLDRKL